MDMKSEEVMCSLRSELYSANGLIVVTRAVAACGGAAAALGGAAASPGGVAVTIMDPKISRYGRGSINDLYHETISVQNCIVVFRAK